MSPIPEALVEQLTAAKRVVAMTGAGTSAESGIPTFREAQSGLWARFQPEDLATPQAFERDPDTVWRWYQWRRELVRKARPNAGHEALASLAALVDVFTLITQNVDGLHQAAGSGDVIELHGNIMTTICHRTRRTIDPSGLDANADHAPRSPHHRDGLGRPAVVWFGEALPAGALTRAVEAASTCEVYLSIGTSSLVQPAASLAMSAVRGGATVVEINPEQTPLSAYAHHVLTGTSAAILPNLVSRLRSAGS